MTANTEVAVKKMGPTTVAYLPVTGSFNLIPESFVRLYGWINKNGYTPSGPPSVAFHNTPDRVPEEQLSWELRGPLAGSTPTSEPDEDGVGVKQLEAILVAATMHRGPYEAIDTSFYDALAKWIVENGYDIIGPCEEVYFSDPNTSPDDTLTEVRFPVRRK
ncbi:MAG: GyrI-like domain-containing protein [Chloroflexota bacterium]